jgi:hypothetical protein
MFLRGNVERFKNMTDYRLGRLGWGERRRERRK